MFGRLFKRKSVVTEPASHPSPGTPPDWPAQLDAARGDEEALLKLAQSTAPHGVRLAAVQALTGADALRTVEQAFRGRDKALYRAARHQLDTLTRQHTAHTSATRLLQEARQLTQTAAMHAVPANHLVELDQAWRALDEDLLETEQRNEFAQLQTTLARQVREHNERQRDAQREQERLAAEQSAQEAAARQAATEAAQAQQQCERERLQTSRLAEAQAHQQSQQARTQLEAHLATLEATLASGQVTDVPTQMKQIAQLRELAATATTDMDTALQSRIHHLEAEYARLKDWQHWGDEQMRLNLIEAAEQLAATARTVSSLKQHAQDIEQLRARWKASGSASSSHASNLWKRFDAALTLAWQPVAEQRQQLATAREQNLETRRGLLAELEAHPCPETTATTTHQTTDWRALSQALERFHHDWRKLGPLEHTVTKHEQPALQARLAHTLAMYEAPLHTARQTARQQRQQLIEQMRQLPLHERDIVAKVRALQAEWQSSTHAVPLPRKDEHRLWTEFKTATDALFQQRTEARDRAIAAQEAAQTAQTDLIAQLHALTHSSQETPETLERKLTALEQQWRDLTRQTPHQARPHNPHENRFRSARQQVQRHLQHLRQQQWETACHALLITWQRCKRAGHLAESSAIEDVAGLVDALPPQIPAPWREALQTRDPVSRHSPDDVLLDTTLLRLETLLELATPEDFQAARRDLKLQDMKRALETRAAHSSESLESLLACALRLSPAQAEQSVRSVQSIRLHNILKALPQHPLRP